MPYDLYGQYYQSKREAINAELAQMAEIDNHYNRQRIQKLEQREQQRENPEIWQYIQMLEDRITALENQLKQ
jgi:hypothetical protein